MFEEVLKYEKELHKKAGLSITQLKELLHDLLFLDNVNIVPLKEFRMFLEEAQKISPDGDDMSYFALALQRKCALLSNDKKLKEQKSVQVYKTEELPS